MENYILNRKQLNLEKNKEMVFEVPTLTSPFADYTIECPDLNFDEIVTFGINLFRNKNKIYKEITLVSGFNFMDFNDKEFEDGADYTILSCICSKSIHLVLTIKKD